MEMEASLAFSLYHLPLVLSHLLSWIIDQEDDCHRPLIIQKEHTVLFESANSRLLISGLYVT